MTGHAADIAARFMQADRLRQAGKTDDAERICREVLNTAPSYVPAMNLLAALLGRRGELAQGEALARRAVEQAPAEPALHNTLGNLLFRHADYAGAEAAYRKSLALDPSQPEASYNLSLALEQNGLLDEALAAARAAVRLRPDYVEAMTQTGALLRLGQRNTESLKSLDQALLIKPDHFPALYYRGLVLLSLHGYAQALAPLESAVALKPESAEARHALGNALGYMGREAEALAAYQKAIEIAPAYVNAHVDYDALAWSMGLKQACGQSFAYARYRLGDVPDLLLAEAEQRLHFSDPARAEALMQRAHELAPERGDIRRALGRALTGLGRFDEAVGLFEQASNRDEANGREYATALLHARRPAQALGVLETARQAAPDDQFLLGLMTLAMREMKDPRLAAMIDGAVRVYDLPAPPGFADMDVFNRDLAEDLVRLHTRRVAPHDQTLRGGTQTPGNLFSAPSRLVLQLRDLLRDAVADYIARMPDDPAHPLFARRQQEFHFSGSWSCRLRPDGFHTNHLHPAGWISSAYYVQVPSSVNAASEAGWIKFGESSLALGEQDRPDRTICPLPGRLVLFPSYMWHGTVPFPSGQDRMTVAFDVLPGPSTQIME